MTTVIKDKKTGKEWSIYLYSSSPKSTAVVINNLNKCIVWKLYINNTLLDSECTSILSEILKTNKTIMTLQLFSSSLIDGIKQIGDSFLNNTILIVSIV